MVLEYDAHLSAENFDKYITRMIEDDEKRSELKRLEALEVNFQELETRTIEHYTNAALEKRISNLADMVEKSIKKDSRSAYQKNQDEALSAEREKNKDEALFYRLLLAAVFISAMYIVTCVTTCTIHSNELDLEKASLNTESWKTAYQTLKEEAEQRGEH